MENHLTEEQALDLVEKYMKKEGPITSTQEILDSNAVPRLKGYIVRPGKVSDSIFGGKGDFLDKKKNKIVYFENPTLDMADDTPLRAMVRTQRISTHDINRGEIPFKDQILAMNHNYMRRLLMNSIGTSQYDIPELEDNAVAIAAENLKQIGFENVLRAYMAKSSTSTSLYQHFIKGGREFCGHLIPDNVIPNGPLPYIMDTPSTKSDEHDESVTPQYLIDNKICTLQEYNQIRNGSILAFGIASGYLRQKGIILVDTKYEHGKSIDNTIKAQDEIVTMDSSRFWLLDDYNAQRKMWLDGQIQELAPKSYSKEFARDFSKGEQGYTDEQRAKIAVRYITGIQHLLGERFVPDMRPRDERVVDGLNKVVDCLVK